MSESSFSENHVKCHLTGTVSHERGNAKHIGFAIFSDFKKVSSSKFDSENTFF